MGRLPRKSATLSLVVTALAAAVLLASGAGAAALSVDLGTADSFAVLAGTTVTNTGPSVISGDLGLSPGTAVTGFPPGIVTNGTIHAADAVAAQAQANLTTAYNVAAGLPCTVTLTGQDLGGLTLTRGVYCFASSAQLTGTLTLDAQGDPGAEFIFQMGSTLTTASASRVLLVNQAQACRVFHQVGSSATLGTGTQFVGTILALTSIAATTGASVQGRLLARNGAVTLDTNTIFRPTCLPATTTTVAPATTATTATGTTGVTTATTTGSATATTRVAVPPITVPLLTGAITPAGGSSLGTPASGTPAAGTPAKSSSNRLVRTGGEFASPVALGLLAIVAGALMLVAPRLRAARSTGGTGGRG